MTPISNSRCPEGDVVALDHEGDVVALDVDGLLCADGVVLAGRLTYLKNPKEHYIEPVDRRISRAFKATGGHFVHIETSPWDGNFGELAFCVPEATIAFVSWLYSKAKEEKIKLVLYSAGLARRNRQLWNGIVNLAFSKQEDRDAASKIPIFSRGDLNQNRQKDLRQILARLGHPDDLSRILIIDNNNTVPEGQQGSLLLVPGIEGDVSLGKHPWLFSSDEKWKNYNEEGERPLKCRLILEEHSGFETAEDLQNSHRILVTYPNFEVLFLDKNTGALRREKVEDPFLVSELEKLKGKKRIKNEATLKALYIIIKEWGGKTTKICRKMNRTFAIAGVVNKIFETMGKTSAPIAGCNFEVSWRDEEWYHKGRKVLGGDFFSPSEWIKQKTALPEEKSKDPSSSSK